LDIGRFSLYPSTEFGISPLSDGIVPKTDMRMDLKQSSQNSIIESMFQKSNSTRTKNLFQAVEIDSISKKNLTTDSISLLSQSRNRIIKLEREREREREREPDIPWNYRSMSE